MKSEVTIFAEKAAEVAEVAYFVAAAADAGGVGEDPVGEAREGEGLSQTLLGR